MQIWEYRYATAMPIKISGKEKAHLFIDVTPSPKKKCYSVTKAFMWCHMKRRIPPKVCVIDVRSIFKQSLENLRVIASRKKTPAFIWINSFFSRLATENYESVWKEP